MERRPDDLFRIHDLSVLKSPMPTHLLGGGKRPSSLLPPVGNVQPLRPTPMTSNTPFGLSTLIATVNSNSPNQIQPSLGTRRPLGVPKWSPLGGQSEKIKSSSSPLIKASVVLEENATLSTAGKVSPELNHTIPDRKETTEIDDENTAESINNQPNDVIEPKKEPKIPNESKAKMTTLTVGSNISKGGLAKKDGSIELSKWSLVIVPNNTNVTKLEKSVTEDWIVLIGKRTDMTDMWHSSLITERISNRDITTGSGRIYKLNGDLDEDAMIEGGFSFGFVETFKDGFPRNWKELLLQEFSAAKSPSTKGKKEVVKTLSLTKLAKTKKYTSDAKFDVSQLTDTITNTNHANKADPSPRRNRKSEPISRWRDNLSPVVTSDITILGTTRSGRRVIKPLPYWKNKYLRKDLSSPTVDAVSRRKLKGD